MGRVCRQTVLCWPVMLKLMTTATVLKWKSFSRVRLFVTPWIVACQAPLSMEFSRQEWVAVPFSRGSSQPRDGTHVSCIACGFFFLFFPFTFISWRLITLQYCSGFCHTLMWISHGFTCVPHSDCMWILYRLSYQMVLSAFYIAVLLINFHP